MHTTPAFATASAQARARASVRSTGFSQNTCFFCAADCRIRSACVSVLEQIDRRADRRIAHRAVDVRDLRAVLRGERGRGLAVHVDDVLQPHARLPREIAA